MGEYGLICITVSFFSFFICPDVSFSFKLNDVDVGESLLSLLVAFEAWCIDQRVHVGAHRIAIYTSLSNILRIELSTDSGGHEKAEPVLYED